MGGFFSICHFLPLFPANSTQEALKAIEEITWWIALSDGVGGDGG